MFIHVSRDIYISSSTESSDGMFVFFRFNLVKYCFINFLVFFKRYKYTKKFKLKCPGHSNWIS